VTTMTAVAVRFQPTTGRLARMSHAATSAVSVLLLTPGAMLAMVFGLWRLGQDLGWTANFVISQGLFSHWVVWMALSAGLKTTANLATRGPQAQTAADSPGR
jgi:hypothetical protein